MSTVEEIKAAIDRLSEAERAKLEAMLDRENDEWDRQMMADAKSGKLDKLIAEADADIEAGNLREFP
jgi:hypothetical protein